MTASHEETLSAPHPHSRKNPFADHLRLSAITVKGTTARLELLVEEIHLRSGGVVHGGIFATLLDTVTGYAAYSAAPKGAEVLTIQLNMNMTATARQGDTIIATASVVHSGRRTAVVTGELRLPDGKLLVTGSGTFFFVDGRLT
jgi:uncharacterized protein (TIGR00369 family)